MNESVIGNRWGQPKERERVNGQPVIRRERSGQVSVIGGLLILLLVWDSAVEQYYYRQRLLVVGWLFRMYCVACAWVGLRRRNLCNNVLLCVVGGESSVFKRRLRCVLSVLWGSRLPSGEGPSRDRRSTR
jgi:hypothetical protein